MWLPFPSYSLSGIKNRLTVFTTEYKNRPPLLNRRLLLLRGSFSIVLPKPQFSPRLASIHLPNGCKKGKNWVGCLGDEIAAFLRRSAAAAAWAKTPHQCSEKPIITNIVFRKHWFWLDCFSLHPQCTSLLSSINHSHHNLNKLAIKPECRLVKHPVSSSLATEGETGKSYHADEGITGWLIPRGSFRLKVF